MNPLAAVPSRATEGVGASERTDRLFSRFAVNDPYGYRVMSVLTEVALLCAGLGMLVVGSDRTVSAASSLAHAVGVPSLFIGGTVVAVGSSIPEIATSVYAAAYDVDGLVVGHIVGSATAQITLGIGVIALVAPLTIPRAKTRTYGGGMVFAMAVMLLAVRSGSVTRVEGVVMVAAYVLFISWCFDEADYDAAPVSSDSRESSAWSIAVAVVGLALVALGGHLLVTNARALATEIAVSQHFLGLVTGLGTTAPEVVIAAFAISRGEGDIAVGTLLGSNITDPLFSLGAGAAVGGVAVADTRTAVLATAYMLLVSLGVVALLYRRERLTRRHAVPCLLLYAPILAL